MIKFIEYPKCSTCKKAKNYLDELKIDYLDIDIKLNNPSKEEIRQYYLKSGLDIKKLFNTSGLLYKELDLKNKLDAMTLEEKLDILASNGMLIKRPILVLDNQVFFGFKQEDWKKALK